MNWGIGTVRRAVAGATMVMVLAGATAAQAAQEVRLLKDINPGEAHSDAFYATTLDGRAIFPADDGVHGRELWSSDGTTAGTTQLAEINPGFTGSNAYAFGIVEGTYLFVASSPDTGLEPWISDGTAAGTRLLADLNDGPADSAPNYCGYVGGRYVFFAENTLTGEDSVYMTDGQTIEVKPVVPRAGCELYKGRLYFDADDGAKGDELWATNGTAAGTVLVKDIAPNLARSYPHSFAIAGEGDSQKLVFGADSGGHMGDQLWVTDGTTDGTVMIKDYGDGNLSQTEPAQMTRLGTRVYFRATDEDGSELWASDGTPSGTVQLADLNPGPASSQPYMQGFASDGALLIQATVEGIGTELFRSDGTEAGTALLKDIEPGPESSYPGTYGNAIDFGGKTYFSATTAATGAELFETDGTPAGTKLAADLRPGPDSSNAGGWAVVGDKLFVIADVEGIGREPHLLGEFPSEQPPIDVPPGTTDTTPPALELTARAKQKVRKRLRVTIAAAGEVRTVRAGAVLRLGKKRVMLPGVQRTVPAGQPEKIAFRLSRKTRARVKRMLRKGRKVRAAIGVVAADAAGNEASASRTVRLVRR